MLVNLPEKLWDRIRCPRCRDKIGPASPAPERAYACTNSSCLLSKDGFPDIAGVPALVDFERSVLDRANIIALAGASYKTRKVGAFNKLQKRLLRSEGPTAKNVSTFLAQVKRTHARPIILVIGGGTLGADAGGLYADPDVVILGSDVYRSELTHIIADGHHLPLADNSVHGVWIQAVLEHVLNPYEVVAEIHRVLAPQGVVYAETPFMQQVHEGAYDFTRFSLSGHRWLFRHFSEIESGITRGPATVMLWAVRYFVGSLFGTNKAGSIAAVSLFWLRYFEKISKPKHAVDAPSGVFFLGQRAEVEMKPKDIISYYRGAQS